MKRASVLFVCMGNICRSPAAEAVMEKLSQDSELDIQIDSAGTEGYHQGERADSRMRAAASARGLEMASRARKVTPNDLKLGTFSLVIAMDHANLQRLRSISGGDLESHVRLFSDFLDDRWPEEVPDPYYGGDDGFETVLDMLEAGCPSILSELAIVGESSGR